MFDKLFYKKSTADNDFRVPIQDPYRAYAPTMARELLKGSDKCFISILPNELMLLVLQFTDVLTFTRTSSVCKEWQKIKAMKGVGRIYKT